MVSALASSALAKDYDISQNSNQNATIDIKTWSIEAYRDRQIRTCTNAILLAKDQSNGRLMGSHQGLAISACSPMLHSSSCSTAFIRTGPRRASRSKGSARVAKSCARDYCSVFLNTDRERLCDAQLRPKNRDWLSDFFTTALRYEFLKTNHVSGLQKSPFLAQGLIPRN